MRNILKHKDLLAILLALLIALSLAASIPHPDEQTRFIESQSMHIEEMGDANEILVSFAESFTHTIPNNELSNADAQTPWFSILAVVAAALLILAVVLSRKDNRRLKKLVALRDQELEEANKKIAERDIRDPLTKLYTRHFFNEQALIEMDRALRLESRLGLIMMDPDDFKQINDNYGEEAGDLVLQTVAKFLQQNLRGHDLMARYESEKFVILMNTIEPEIFSQRAESIRQSIMEIETHYKDQTIQVTCSIGGAIFPKDARNLEKLIELADDMLHKSKQGGKNQVCIYTGEEEAPQL